MQAAAWPPTSWASVIAITTTSCCAPPVTCSISTLESFWVTPRCSAASRGESQTCWALFGVTSYWRRHLCVFDAVSDSSHPTVSSLGALLSLKPFFSPPRDRAPFVLTSDMAYVINGGERPTSRFQLFVDLCCQSYNLMRKHSGLFLNLLSLVSPTSQCLLLVNNSDNEDVGFIDDFIRPSRAERLSGSEICV